MEVRRAAREELPAVMTVLDAGLLVTSADEVETAVEAGLVLVAVEGDRVLGALVLEDEVPTEGARIEAVAVSRRRRGQGIGTALVRAAVDDYGRLVAEFDGDVRPFWESLGFEIDQATVPGRYVGWIDER